MLYKTIILELLQQTPSMHDQLRRDRKLLTTVNQWTMELKSRHDELQDVYSRTMKDINPTQIARMAMETAVQELQDRLRNEFPPTESEALSLDAAMAFIRRHSSPV